MRQRDEDAGPADRRKLGDRRGARARHDEMARRHARRQIFEERRHVTGDLQPRIDVADARQILIAGLLHDLQPRPQLRLELFDGRRNDVRHHAGALAAAEYEKLQGPAIDERRIADRRRGDHRRPHRITGVGRLCGQRRIIVENPRKARGDGAHARRQHPVGAADHRVLFVDQRGNTAQARGEQRRDGRIAAEADDHRGLEPRQHHPGFEQAVGQQAAGFCQRQRIAAAGGLPGGRGGIVARCHGLLLEHFRRGVQRLAAQNDAAQMPVPTVRPGLRRDARRVRTGIRPAAGRGSAPAACPCHRPARSSTNRRKRRTAASCPWPASGADSPPC